MKICYYSGREKQSSLYQQQKKNCKICFKDHTD